MAGLTDFITQATWVDIFPIWFVLVDDAYGTLEARWGRWRRRGPQPRFTDSEVITLALIIETFFHGNEERGLSFVRQYHPDLFPCVLPNGQFNYRRRLLCRITELIRRYLVQEWALISATDRPRLLDSAPVPLSTYTRGARSQTVAGQEFFGYCSSKGSKYCGVKLFLTASSQPVVDKWLLVPAAHHDSEALGAVLEDEFDLLVLADGAFHKPVLGDLLDRRQLKVAAPPRRDSRAPWSAELRALVGKLRRRVETTLSVLETVFAVEHPKARSTDGVFARVATKLLAYTLCFITQPLLDALGS